MADEFDNNVIFVFHPVNDAIITYSKFESKEGYIPRSLLR
jgi:CRISPR/Cas system CSM-associated protein Csm2 small subunit